MNDYWLLAGDLLAVLGTLGLSAAVFGVVRLSDGFAKIHAAAVAMVLGAVPVLLAAMLVGSAAVAMRALLVIFAVLFTVPLGAHALAHLQAQQEDDAG